MRQLLFSVGAPTWGARPRKSTTGFLHMPGGLALYSGPFQQPSCHSL